MADLYKVSELVKQVLESYPASRNSDNHLYYFVLKIVGKRTALTLTVCQCQGSCYI